jgi:hypothetical protein
MDPVDLVDHGYSRVVTQEKCTIVTVRPLVLTQEANPKQEYVTVNPAIDLEVMADVVTIRGRIKAPKKTIKIFARVLNLEGVSTPQGLQPPELNVDGGDGGAHGNPAALAEGARGPPGYNDCIEPKAPAAPPCTSWKGGGNGQTANDTEWAWVQGSPDPQWQGFQWDPKNAWMHGNDGQEGKAGDSAGAIFVVCDSFSFSPANQHLILSAKGGRAGAGQKGQDGAKGGDGGDGSNAQVGVGIAKLGYKNATPGGNGGMGGNGGRGGKGGDGGNGGRIVFRCVNGTSDKIVAFADGGPKGQPGEGGAPGRAGLKGIGGRGATLWQGSTLRESYPGRDGAEGRIGKVRGAEGADGADGFIELSLHATYPDLKSVLRKAFV